MKQFVFDLPRREDFGREDFFVSDSNAAALSWIERWPQWPAPVLVVHGSRGAGKTHLAHLWCKRAEAIFAAGPALAEAHFEEIIEGRHPRLVIDDADHAPERELLHLYNACLEAGGELLLTARRPPGPWQPALADLGSRLRAAPAVGIDLPDDTLLGAVLAKHFADRQVRVAPEVIAYLVRHMERSLASAGQIAAALDEKALSLSGAITIPLASEMVARINQRFSPGDDAAVT
jgi:chromosomal replication initiation ATPase DnaA